MQAGGAVELEVDIQHPAFRAVKAQPVPAFRDRNDQLDQRIGLAGFGRSGEQHFVSLPQHAPDERVGQIGQAVPDVFQIFCVGQVIGHALDPLLPFGEVGLTDIGVDQELLFAVPHDAGHTGQARRVAVLLVELQPVAAAYRIQVFHPLAVFRIVSSVDMYDRMQALAARVHQTGHRQLQLADERVLPLKLHAVALNERIAVLGHILVAHALAVEGVEADPRPDRRVIVAQHRADVVLAFAQRFDELAGRARPVPFGWRVPAVLFKTARHIADVFCGIE